MFTALHRTPAAAAKTSPRRLWLLHRAARSAGVSLMLSLGHSVGTRGANKCFFTGIALIHISSVSLEGGWKDQSSHGDSQLDCTYLGPLDGSVN